MGFIGEKIMNEQWKRPSNDGETIFPRNNRKDKKNESSTLISIGLQLGCESNMSAVSRVDEFGKVDSSLLINAKPLDLLFFQGKPYIMGQC